MLLLFLLMCTACHQKNPLICQHPAQKHTVQKYSEWKIGAKLHFEEESGSDYIGLKEINALTHAALKSVLIIKKDICDRNAKILLKQEKNFIVIDHYREKSKTQKGEELHATLLYTSPRGFHAPETLTQVCPILFNDCLMPPSIELVSLKYASIIKPYWRFKIDEVVIVHHAKGAFILAKLLFDDHEHIYFDGKSISAGLHLTLVNCTDPLLLSDAIVRDTLLQKLNEKLQGRFIKVASKNQHVDLEFGLSGQSWRLHAGEIVP